MRYLLEALEDLDSQLKKHGGRLIMIKGKPNVVFRRLWEEFGMWFIFMVFFFKYRSIFRDFWLIVSYKSFILFCCLSCASDKKTFFFISEAKIYDDEETIR